MFYAVDSDLRPLWLAPVTRERGEALGAHTLLPTGSYHLAWATRFGVTRWFVFPS